MYCALHVNHPLFLSDFIIKLSQQLIEKYPNVKFHENPSSGSRVVQCGQTDGQVERYDEVNGRLCAILRTRLKQQMQTPKYSTFLQLILLKPVYKIQISSSAPYSQTQSAFFHLNDSSKFHSIAKGKTTSFNILFLMGMQNILK
jgi:glycine betaine/choline ABC-type transport system substrate-binding protein